MRRGVRALPRIMKTPHNLKKDILQSNKAQESPPTPIPATPEVYTPLSNHSGSFSFAKSLEPLVKSIKLQIPLKRPIDQTRSQPDTQRKSLTQTFQEAVKPYFHEGATKEAQSAAGEPNAKKCKQATEFSKSQTSFSFKPWSSTREESTDVFEFGRKRTRSPSTRSRDRKSPEAKKRPHRPRPKHSPSSRPIRKKEKPVKRAVPTGVADIEVLTKAASDSAPEKPSHKPEIKDEVLDRFGQESLKINKEESVDDVLEPGKPVWKRSGVDIDLPGAARKEKPVEKWTPPPSLPVEAEEKINPDCNTETAVKEAGQHLKSQSGPLTSKSGNQVTQRSEVAGKEAQQSLEAQSGPLTTQSVTNVKDQEAKVSLRASQSVSKLQALKAKAFAKKANQNQRPQAEPILTSLNNKLQPSTQASEQTLKSKVSPAEGNQPHKLQKPVVVIPQDTKSKQRTLKTRLIPSKTQPLPLKTTQSKARLQNPSEGPEIKAKAKEPSQLNPLTASFRAAQSKCKVQEIREVLKSKNTVAKAAQLRKSPSAPLVTSHSEVKGPKVSQPVDTATKSKSVSLPQNPVQVPLKPHPIPRPTKPQIDQGLLRRRPDVKKTSQVSGKEDTVVSKVGTVLTRRDTAQTGKVSATATKKGVVESSSTSSIAKSLRPGSPIRPSSPIRPGSPIRVFRPVSPLPVRSGEPPLGHSAAKYLKQLALSERGFVARAQPPSPPLGQKTSESPIEKRGRSKSVWEGAAARLPSPTAKSAARSSASCPPLTSANNQVDAATFIRQLRHTLRPQDFPLFKPDPRKGGSIKEQPQSSQKVKIGDVFNDCISDIKPLFQKMYEDLVNPPKDKKK